MQRTRGGRVVTRAEHIIWTVIDAISVTVFVVSFIIVFA
jgi:hypothetical protein